MTTKYHRSMLLILHQQLDDHTKTVSILSLYQLPYNKISSYKHTYKMLQHDIVHRGTVPVIPDIFNARRCVTDRVFPTITKMSTWLIDILRNRDYRFIKVKMYVNSGFNGTWALHPERVKKATIISAKIIEKIEGYFVDTRPSRTNIPDSITSASEFEINKFISDKIDYVDTRIAVGLDDRDNIILETEIDRDELEVQDENKVIAGKLCELRDEKTHMERIIKRMGLEKRRLEQVIKKEQELSEQLKIELHTKVEDLSSLTNDAEKYTTQISDMENKIAHMTEDFKVLQIENVEYSAQIAENEVIRSKMDGLNAREKAYMCKIDLLRAQIKANETFNMINKKWWEAIERLENK